MYLFLEVIVCNFVLCLSLLFMVMIDDSKMIEVLVFWYGRFEYINVEEDWEELVKNVVMVDVYVLCWGVIKIIKDREI